MGSSYSAEESSQRKSENDKWKGDADYADFWRKVDNSEINGHDDLKDFLETNTKILIGEKIPNKAFWEKLKGIEASKFLTKLAGTIADLPQETEDNIVNITQEDDTGNDETIEHDTVFRIILDNVYNGHQLILHILDGLVEKIGSNRCYECVDNKREAKININISKMFNFSENKSTKSVLSKKTKSLVRNLINLQRERPGDDNIKRIFQHPVIELLILRKWDDYKMPYIINVQLFGFVVLLFTFFVRLRILEEAKIKCHPANFTSIYSDWWKEEIKTNDVVDRMLNCGDWVGSNISEEILNRCDPADIANNASF